MAGTFRGEVLADGLVLVTGCTLLAGVLAEDLLLASAGDTFLGGVLSEGLLLDTARRILLVV